IDEAGLLQVLQRWVPRGTDAAAPAAGPVDTRLCLVRANGRPDLARDMLGSLIAILPAECADLEAAAAQGQRQALLDCVHRLHGSSCYSGVPRLKQACEALETLLKNHPEADCTAELDHLRGAITELQAWAEEHDLAVLFNPA